MEIVVVIKQGERIYSSQKLQTFHLHCSVENCCIILPSSWNISLLELPIISK